MISLQEYFVKMKTIQALVLCFIENDDNAEENYDNLIKIVKDQKIRTDKHKLKTFLYMINQISTYHRHCRNFFEKIEMILQSIQLEIQNNFSNSEIFDIFINNKRILLFLFEEKIVTIDDQIYNKIIEKPKNYQDYFSPEIKSFLDKKGQQNDKPRYFEFSQHVQNIPNNEMKNFNEKRKKGENESLICKIIREDSLDEFISHIKENNFDIKDLYVSQSTFETSPFLLHRRKTLIKYSAFFGSFKIFKYLYENGAHLSNSVWIYAIHSENEDIIRFLIDKNVVLPSKLNHKNIENNFCDFVDDFKDLIQLNLDNVTYERCIVESIMCHHNDIAKYIIKNCMNEDNNNFYTSIGFRFYNFFFITEISEYKQLLFYGCKYDYYDIVNHLLESKEIDINSTVI